MLDKKDRNGYCLLVRTLLAKRRKLISTKCSPVAPAPALPIREGVHLARGDGGVLRPVGPVRYVYHDDG